MQKFLEFFSKNQGSKVIVKNKQLQRLYGVDYEKEELVKIFPIQKATNYFASTVSTFKPTVKSEDGEVQDIITRQFIDLFNRNKRANTGFSCFEDLITLLTKSYLIEGEAFLRCIYNAKGEALSIHIVESDYISSNISSVDGFIDYMEIDQSINGRTQGKSTLRFYKRVITPSYDVGVSEDNYFADGLFYQNPIYTDGYDILYFIKKPDLNYKNYQDFTRTFRGKSCLDFIGNEARTYYSIVQGETYALNGSMSIPTVIMPDTSANAQEYILQQNQASLDMTGNKLKENFIETFLNRPRGFTGGVESLFSEFPIKMLPREDVNQFNLDTFKTSLEGRIVGHFNIPREVIDSASAKYDNKAIAMKDFFANVATPTAMVLFEFVGNVVYNSIITGLNYNVEPDIETSPYAGEILVDKAIKLFKEGIITQDESREMCGYEPLTEEQKMANVNQNILSNL